MSPRLTRTLRSAAAGTLLLALLWPARPAIAADNPYERGPDPTVASIEAATGSFAIATTTVARSSVSGFGGGTIYYPTSTAEGTFGAVAISPGFTASQSAISWLAPRIASQGFVVFTIDTLTTLDYPDSRGTQLLAALDYLTGSSSVRTRIDASRTAVMGHSMGGGGSLSAARTRPSLQAIVPMTPWHNTKSFPTITVPTLIIGAENDTVAPPASHAEPFYTSIPATTDKAYLEINNADHDAPSGDQNLQVSKYGLTWLKRFVDDDTRYDQFLCPNPSGTAIQEWRSTCPYS